MRESMITSRRFFLKHISKLNLFAFLAFNIPFIKIAENEISASLKFRKYFDMRHMRHKTYKVNIICKPKKIKKYSSIDDFWTDHHDQPVYDLNTLFKNQSKLVFNSSKLLKSGYTALLTKEYKSREDYLLYRKMWNVLSRVEKHTLYFQKV